MEKLLRLLVLPLLCAALLLLHGHPAAPARVHKSWRHGRFSATETQLKDRLLIGSVAPTCTYNECRGCPYKCSAQQVPVEGNDPINSAYHYRCVCHR